VHDHQRVVPYQWVLRALGAYLDTQGASHIMVMETPSGFAARHQPDVNRPTLELAEFSRDDLVRSRREMESARNRWRLGGSDPLHVRGTYQDSLRALGYDLEQVAAYGLLIEELDDLLLVTYQYHSPDSGYLLRKHLSIMGEEEQRGMIQIAHSRRNVGPAKRGLFRR
jgi:hypothetical protein